MQSATRRLTEAGGCNRFVNSGTEAAGSRLSIPKIRQSRVFGLLMPRQSALAATKPRLAESILSARDKQAGAARLTEDALVACTYKPQIVITGDQLSLINPEFTVE
jgi:hypothetical protein